jgi:esterase/lipase superfamily enzyme
MRYGFVLLLPGLLSLAACETMGNSSESGTTAEDVTRIVVMSRPATTSLPAPSPAPPPPPPAAAAPAPPPPPAAAAARIETRGNEILVEVFYGTDRRAVTEPVGYGVERGSDISYGSAIVSVPPNHRLGYLEAPRWWRLEFSEDPGRHLMLRQVQPLNKARFVASLSQRVAQSAGKNAFVFVHGYNVSFVDAARRTAQIAHDLKFPGAPIFYSWPSQAKTIAYTVDENNIEWTRPRLVRFLEEVVEGSGAENVHLIAHSMGNRALTQAFAEFYSRRPDLMSRIREVILAAPDIDAAVFKEQIAPTLLRTQKPITLYASSRDKALMASKEVHAYPRAGDTDGGLIVLPGMETIDASAAQTDVMDFLDHSYFAEGKSILSDIFYVVQGRRAKDRFGLEPLKYQGSDYWRVRP